MREIKFRAWDENSQEMIYEVGITPEGIPYSIPENAEGCDQFNYFLTCHKMQYTGLKDKNGRDIYEGDIVIDGRKNSAEVVFDDGCFCVIGYLGDLRTHPLRDSLFCGERFEVIGNIYEDPELQEASHASK
ncbi:YopX family protein [Bacillus inaquosorum]|uniref:YopX family protein n=1 Tax=Bacillus inaquosorum TaxID=483913 RepID=UPI00227DAABC|nr:YopX family protein [Bacillus inaquosorum]MCY9082380.1 YopX family protein [Bacillus inaquosorum]